MTKFFNYINETDTSLIVDALKKDCQPFIKDLKKIKKGQEQSFLYIGRFIKTSFMKKQVRQDRNPSDTPEEIHKFVDNWFYKKFGVRLRSNSVFATFSFQLATAYGFPYFIFPIGKYDSYFSHNSKDLFLTLKKLYYDEMPASLESFKDYENFLDGEKIEIKKIILDWLNNQSKYQKGLKYTDSEIMIHCKEYYLIDTIHGNDLNNLLKEK